MVARVPKSYIDSMMNLATQEHRLAKPGPQNAELRDYGIGAQILLDLGVKNMVLLSNRARTIIGLEGYGLNVVETRAINTTGRDK